MQRFLCRFALLLFQKPVAGRTHCVFGRTVSGPRFVQRASGHLSEIAHLLLAQPLFEVLERVRGLCGLVRDLFLGQQPQAPRNLGHGGAVQVVVLLQCRGRVVVHVAGHENAGQGLWMQILLCVAAARGGMVSIEFMRRTVLESQKQVVLNIVRFVYLEY